MTNTTNLFTQNWKMTATDEARGFQSNWRVFIPFKAVRLLHVSLASLPRVAHVRLFITTHNGEYFNLVDDDFGADRSAVWNGSMILRNLTSVGAQQFGFLENDIMYLRIIWEEIE